MYSGIVVMRYAKAFLEYTESRHSSEAVLNEVDTLLNDPLHRPEKLSFELEHFSKFLIKKGRISDVRFILQSYKSLYYKLKGIKLVNLVTAVPAPELEERLREILSAKFDCVIHFSSSIDPTLIGGFVLSIDDYRLDASVSKQIESIRRQFVQQNKRIV